MSEYKSYKEYLKQQYPEKKKKVRSGKGCPMCGQVYKHITRSKCSICKKNMMNVPQINQAISYPQV